MTSISTPTPMNETIRHRTAARQVDEQQLHDDRARAMPRRRSRQRGPRRWRREPHRASAVAVHSKVMPVCTASEASQRVERGTARRRSGGKLRTRIAFSQTKPATARRRGRTGSADAMRRDRLAPRPHPEVAISAEADAEVERIDERQVRQRRRGAVGRDVGDQGPQPEADRDDRAAAIAIRQPARRTGQTPRGARPHQHEQQRAGNDQPAEPRPRARRIAPGAGERAALQARRAAPTRRRRRAWTAWLSGSGQRGARRRITRMGREGERPGPPAAVVRPDSPEHAARQRGQKHERRMGDRRPGDAVPRQSRFAASTRTARRCALTATSQAASASGPGRSVDLDAPRSRPARASPPISSGSARLFADRAARAACDGRRRPRRATAAAAIKPLNR